MHPWIYITNKFEDYMASHPKVADFFAWYDGDIDPNDPASYPEETANFWQNTKKAPAEATAGAKNFSKNIYSLSLTREERMRKAANRNG